MDALTGMIILTIALAILPFYELVTGIMADPLMFVLNAIVIIGIIFAAFCFLIASGSKK